MDYEEKNAKIDGVKKQTAPKAGQTELVVTLDSGKELHTFCATEKVNETAKMIKESLKDIESVKMVETD